MFKLICKYNIMIETFEDDGAGIFAPIISPIVGIAKGFVKMGELAVSLVDLIIKVVATIPTIFNPDKLINDVLYGVSNGIPSMFEGILKQFDTNETAPKKGIYDDKKSQVCVAPTLINLIILVLCPPLALYKDRGFSGFFLVIVCALLTYYLYYFPGFLFAALHIMC